MGEGQRHADARAMPLLGFDAEIAAVELGECEGNRQPEARAFMALVEAGIDLAEGAQRRLPGGEPFGDERDDRSGTEAVGDLGREVDAAERLGPALGESVIVENRPGQGGSTALAALAKLPPQ